MAINKVIIKGNISNEVELKQTQSGTSVCSFNVAVNRFAKDSGEAKVDFLTVVAWQQKAEFVTKYFQKGSMIGIEGSIQTRRYTDKETGKNRTAFEVIANNVQFVESKRDGAASSSDAAGFSNAAAGDFTAMADDNEDLPF